MVIVCLSLTMVELDTSFFRNLDADPCLVLEFKVIRQCLLWLIYCLVAGYFLAHCSAKFTDFCIFSLAFLLGKEPWGPICLP